jgi:endonuclease/exonuclease/phosphatase family metal-dependent hydrolase
MSIRVIRQHRRNLLIVLLGLAVVLGGAYAGRRTPVASQQGVGISWPVGCRPVSKTRFRVATYNIHRGKGTDGVRDLGRTTRVLRDTDLIGINEVAGPAFWGGADQAEQLGRSLKIGWLFAPNQYRWLHYYFGNGLLSRLDVDDWTSKPLVYDRVRSHSHRNLVTAEVMVGGQPITFMVTHLDRGEVRPTQLKDVLSDFARHTPAILAGDFNTTAANPLLVAFFADNDNVDAVGRALGAADDRNRIDWIITRGLRVRGGGTEPVGVSDHPCYWVDVELAGPSQGVAAGD